MNLNWDSLLEPIFLFILSLIAGTLWVIIPTDPKRDAAQAALVAPSAIVSKASARSHAATKAIQDPDDNEAKAEVAAVEERVQESAQAAQLSTEELDQLQRQNERTRLDIQNEQRVLGGLDEELRSLEQQVSRMQAGSGTEANLEAASQVRTVRTLLGQKEQEASGLQEQLGVLSAGSDVELPYVPTAAAPTKLPVLVELIHDRAVPVNKKSFRIQEKLSGPAVATRIAAGDSISEMQRPDSSFSKLLSKMKPDKEYLSCLLNADSFAAFREARRIALEKGIDVGWEPTDSSSGQILIYPVRMTRNPPASKGQNLPRVAPILQ